MHLYLVQVGYVVVADWNLIMLVYFSPSISLSSHRQNNYILSFSMFVIKFTRPFSSVTFQTFKRELSGNMPHLVSGFKIPRDREQRSPKPCDELTEAQSSKYNLRKERMESITTLCCLGGMHDLLQTVLMPQIDGKNSLFCHCSFCLLVSDHSSSLAKQPL